MFNRTSCIPSPSALPRSKTTVAFVSATTGVIESATTASPSLWTHIYRIEYVSHRRLVTIVVFVFATKGMEASAGTVSPSFSTHRCPDLICSTSATCDGCRICLCHNSGDSVGNYCVTIFLSSQVPDRILATSATRNGRHICLRHDGDDSDGDYCVIYLCRNGYTFDCWLKLRNFSHRSNPVLFF